MYAEGGSLDGSPKSTSFLAKVGQMTGLDTVDACRFRLMSIRTRIETNWPESGGRLIGRGKGLPKRAEADVTALLTALPSPLPITRGGHPVALFWDGDTDLRAVAGRAVDAALALLEGNSLDVTYPGELQMLQSNAPGAPEPIVVAEPTIGLLVATIIGTLEAVVEAITPLPATAAASELREAASDAGAGRAEKPGTGKGARSHSSVPPRNGRRIVRP
jgi:hypothetical protein